LFHIHNNIKKAGTTAFLYIFIYLCFGMYIDHHQATKYTFARRQFKMQSTDIIFLCGIQQFYKSY